MMSQKGFSISRVGEPKFISDPSGGSVTMQKTYEVRTTPVPSGPLGYDWFMYFNSQFTGPDKRIVGHHDRVDKITIYCFAEDESRLIEVVDAAIAYANQKVETIS